LPSSPRRTPRLPSTHVTVADDDVHCAAGAVVQLAFQQQAQAGPAQHHAGQRHQPEHCARDGKTKIKLSMH
jgi:hypothetical protein